MTFKAIYDEIKEVDKQGKLEINSECDTITLTLNENYKMVAYDNDDETYVEIRLKDKQLNHFHLDDRETKAVFMTAMLKNNPLPTEKELHKIERYHLVYSLGFVFLPLIVLMILCFGFEIQTWKMPIRLLLFLNSFLFCWGVMLFCHKKYKEKNQDIYEKMKNLDFDERI